MGNVFNTPGDQSRSTTIPSGLVPPPISFSNNFPHVWGNRKSVSALSASAIAKEPPFNHSQSASAMASVKGFAALAFTPMDLLSDEIIFSILKFLAEEDLARLSKVNRRLHVLSCDNRLWKAIYEKHFGYHSHRLDPDNYSYFYCFQDCSRMESKTFHGASKTGLSGKLWRFVGGQNLFPNLVKKPMKTFQCDYDPLGQAKDLKLIFLGMSGVGKTALLHRYTTGDFLSSPASTMGGRFMSQKVIIDDVTAKLTLWDISGQERYAQMIPVYYRDASVAIIVFSLSYKDSVSKMKYYVRELRSGKHPTKDTMIVIVGNKSDLKHKVESQGIIDYATEHDLLYVETSARSGENVKELFDHIIRKWRERNKPAATEVETPMGTTPTTSSVPSSSSLSSSILSVRSSLSSSALNPRSSARSTNLGLRRSAFNLAPNSSSTSPTVPSQLSPSPPPPETESGHSASPPLWPQTPDSTNQITKSLAVPTIATLQATSSHSAPTIIHSSPSEEAPTKSSN